MENKKEFEAKEMPIIEINFNDIKNVSNEEKINFTTIEESKNNKIIDKVKEENMVSENTLIAREEDLLGEVKLGNNLADSFEINNLIDNSIMTSSQIDDFSNISETSFQEPNNFNNSNIQDFSEINNYDKNPIINSYETNNFNNMNVEDSPKIDAYGGIIDQAKAENKKNVYLGYNTRLLIYVGIVILLGILSLLLMTKSITMNAKSDLNYKQTSNLDYKVGLKPNDYYKDPYLNKGMQYIASLIDYIDINFNYNFKASNKLNYRYKYYVKADVKVTDSHDENKIIYSKSENITEEKIVTEENDDAFVINESIRIEYEKYNDLVKAFKSSYAIDADSNLDLSLCIEIEDEKGNKIKSIDSRDNMTVRIPLTEQMINISLDYKEINNSNNASVYKEFMIGNKVLFTLSILLLIGTITAIVMLVRFLNKTSKKKSLYEIKLGKILREYDRVIITSRKSVKETGTIVDVNSFEELLDARDNLEKPIVFNEIHKGQKCVFIVNSDNESYRYILKQADLEKEDQK